MDEIHSLSESVGAAYAYSKRYIENEIELFKLNAVERTSIALSRLIYRLFVVVLVMLAVVFLSITAALFISDMTDSHFIGFGSITGFYFLVILIAILLRNSIKRRLSNEFIAVLHEKVDDD